MVYYFTSSTVTPAAFIYVGKDKVESETVPRTLPYAVLTRGYTDEELIKYGLEEDSSGAWPETLLQFHADKLSSAHIYLRMNEGDTWDAIPKDLLTDCVQLTKANSIEGNKKDNVHVVYTPWSNLKKDGSMAVGQVGFKDPKKVKKILVEKRENPIVNRLNKTKVEKLPDLRQEKENRLKELRERDRAAQQERKKEEARIAKERREKAWQRDHAYDDLFSEDAIAQASNQNRGEDFLDDFM